MPAGSPLLQAGVFAIGKAQGNDRLRIDKGNGRTLRPCEAKGILVGSFFAGGGIRGAVVKNNCQDVVRTL